MVTVEERVGLVRDSIVKAESHGSRSDYCRGGLTGRTIGHAKLLRLLGTGSFGEVYEGENQVSGRRVAVKVLLPHLVADLATKQRFLSEARAASQPNNEHIVQYFDGGVTSDGICYLVMELLEGQTLMDVVKKGPMEPRRALRLCDQVARALSATHAIGIVHRDLKPDNLFIVVHPGQGEFIKVLDFGVAKLVRGGAAERLTRVGMVIGTPQYIAPEQWLATRDVDGRADIYALGIILYRCLSGQLPFQAQGALKWMEAHLGQPVPRVSHLVDVPSCFDELIEALLAKDPEDRLPTMDAVRDALRDTLAAYTGVARTDERAQTLMDAPPRLALDALEGEATMASDRQAAAPAVPEAAVSGGEAKGRSWSRVAIAALVGVSALASGMGGGFIGYRLAPRGSVVLAQPPVIKCVECPIASATPTAPRAREPMVFPPEEKPPVSLAGGSQKKPSRRNPAGAHNTRKVLERDLESPKVKDSHVVTPPSPAPQSTQGTGAQPPPPHSTLRDLKNPFASPWKIPDKE